MNKQQLRARVFGAFFAGVFVLGATSTFAAEVEAFDSVEDAYAAESQDFSDMMDMSASNGDEASASVESYDHGGHGHHPHHRGRFVCVARNLRGMTFYGRDRFEYQARQEALNNCYRVRSASCAVVSCQFTH